jgi:hypothetical protein
VAENFVFLTEALFGAGGGLLPAILKRHRSSPLSPTLLLSLLVLPRAPVWEILSCCGWLRAVVQLCITCTVSAGRYSPGLPFIGTLVLSIYPIKGSRVD